MQPRLLKHPARLAGASLLRVQDDKRLVALAREGHDPAFAAIVDRYGAQLERYCARLLGPGRAEDAVQQAFVNAHAAMRASDAELALKPWLYRIAHNAALNVLRAAKDESVALDEDRPGATQTADVVELREQLRETLASIQALPAAQRDALLLREVEGRSHEEIAAALGVTAGGARQHLHRARISLRAAASAITPYPVLARVLNAAADGGSGSDLVSGAGLGAGAGAMKACAGVLAAGAIAGGAVTAQHHPQSRSTRAEAGRVATHRSTTAANAASTPSAAALNTADHGPAGATSHRDSGHGRPGARAYGRRHGTSESHRSGGADDSTTHEDSTEHHGSGGSGGSTGTSGTSGDDGLSHSGSGSSGSGSDDTTTTVTSDDHSGSGSSGSSGPDGGETSTTSTTDDHSGSGSSGSGSGGSDDATTTTTTDD
jgi:RNA polymerase sigma factor (sigma-70 family)